jgi:hypothetical protein
MRRVQRRKILRDVERKRMQGMGKLFFWLPEKTFRRVVFRSNFWQLKFNFS